MFARTLLSAILLLAAPCFSQADQDLMQQGLSAYQNKQYNEARDAFQKLLNQAPTNPAVLHNLALTELQLDQKPLALALWRKALSVEPSFRPARVGRAFLESKMQMRPFETDSLSLWVHRNLESISFFDLLWINALLLAVLGWRWLAYISNRQRALEEETPLPEFPTWAVVATIAFLAVGTLAGLKGRDSFAVRATVTVAKASARSLPGDESVGLFDLNGGNEVLVRRHEKGWTQVQNGEGSSGWVKDSDIFITTER